MFLAAGTVLRERYVIKDIIARGGYGYIYLADCLLKKKHYAVKEMLDCCEENIDIEESIKQFRFEAEILAELDHPQLPHVEDYFEYENKYYLVMEYITGNDLHYIVGRNLSFLSEKQIIEWAGDLCNILDYLHSHKPAPIIYRDLKPENIMLADNGRLMLIDFGIAKVLRKDLKTAPAAKSITPHFSPPEQYSFTEGTDILSDIYSLGATLYYLITRVTPEESIKRLSITDRLLDPSIFNPLISEKFEKIILKAMSINKGDRYQSIKEMNEALAEMDSEKIFLKASSKKDRELEEVKKKAEKFRLMVENANDVIATLDNEGNVTYITEKAEKLIGLTPEKIVGQHFSEFFPVESGMKAYRYFRAPMEGDPAVELPPLRLEAYNYNHEKIDIEISTSRIFDGSKITSRICVIRDVTERVRKEKELAEKIEEFISFTGKIIMTSGNEAVKQKFKSLTGEIAELYASLDFKG